jgi:hypothetical protein
MKTEDFLILTILSCFLPIIYFTLRKRIAKLKNISYEFKRLAEDFEEDFDYIGKWELLSDYDLSINPPVVLLGFMSSDCGWITDAGFWFKGDDKFKEGFYLGFHTEKGLIAMGDQYTHWTPSLIAPKSCLI